MDLAGSYPPDLSPENKSTQEESPLTPAVAHPHKEQTFRGMEQSTTFTKAFDLVQNHGIDDSLLLYHLCVPESPHLKERAVVIDASSVLKWKAISGATATTKRIPPTQQEMVDRGANLEFIINNHVCRIRPGLFAFLQQCASSNIRFPIILMCYDGTAPFISQVSRVLTHSIGIPVFYHCSGSLYCTPDESKVVHSFYLGGNFNVDGSLLPTFGTAWSTNHISHRVWSKMDMYHDSQMTIKVQGEMVHSLQGVLCLQTKAKGQSNPILAILNSYVITSTLSNFIQDMLEIILTIPNQLDLEDTEYVRFFDCQQCSSFKSGFQSLCDSCTNTQK